MRLSQVYIRQYGPLQKDLKLDRGINVIRGPNESGKSLLVEGLLKQLADESVPNSVVTGSPEGFVEIVDDGVRETLRDGDSLAGFCEKQYSKEIRPEDLRNVFIIRSGDLTFHERDNFYTHITDKLTGRRVEDIDVIKDALIEEGRLTSTRLDISSDNNYYNAGTQIQDARDLRKKVENYVESARKAGIEQAESEYFSAKQREEELDEKIDELEKAKKEEQKRDRYEALIEDTKVLEANIEELESLPANSDLEEIDERIQDLTEKETQHSELEKQKESNLSLAKWSIGAGVVTFGLLIAFGFPTGSVIAPLLFLGSAGYFSYQAKKISKAIKEISGKEENILSDARAIGLSFERKDEIRERISDIKDRREHLESMNQGKKAVLERELGFDTDSIEDIVSNAHEELEALASKIDDSFQTDFDEQELDAAKKELKQVKEERERLEDELGEHQEKLQKFRDQANELNFSVFVGERLDIEVTNLDALLTLIDRLQEFIAAIEADAEASRVAIGVFDEIQDEEKKETAELFEENSRATEIFREITAGRYEKVTYDNEENQLKVVKSTGETFVPEEMSDGTHDQLYLSIRVALGEQILDGQSGFFIMDDAFLSSDSQRLEVQADVVDKLANKGWQFVYLSSKEDAVSVLSTRCDNKIKELSPLE